MAEQGKRYPIPSRRMKSGLINHEFRVFYQQKAGRSGKLINSSEALTRWISPENFTPDQFFKAAEWHDLLLSLSWEICQIIAQDLEVYPFETVSINLSSTELHSEFHLKRLCRILDPKKVRFEILETSLLTIETIENLHYLSEIGYLIGIDDYGKGYSNILRVMECPIDYLKIDKSLIDNCLEPKFANIIKAIAHYCHETLDIPVTAEGVERQEQFGALLNLDIDRFQGYLFSRPKPPEEIYGKQICPI